MRPGTEAVVRTSSVPLQVILVEDRPDELVIDCVVAERVVVGPGRVIAAGTPFTIIVDPESVVGGAGAALEVLDRWSETCNPVEASGSVELGMIRLQSEGQELVLDVP